ESLGNYEKSLDEAAAKVMARINKGDKLRMMWVSGPSSSGKTTTTVKLTDRLQKQGLRFLMLISTITSGPSSSIPRTGSTTATTKLPRPSTSNCSMSISWDFSMVKPSKSRFIALRKVAA